MSSTTGEVPTPIKIKQNIPGNPISIQWDKEDGEDWIIIKASGKIIMKAAKNLWDDGAGTEFTPEIRDAILTHARRLYG